MHCFPTPGIASRWCFRIPRRLGNAPSRNRVRRLLREFVRTHKNLWPANSAVVLTANLTAVDLSYHRVSEQLERLLVHE